MFVLNHHHVYRAESFEQFPWMEHGFGTRRTNGWPRMEQLVTPRQVHSDRVLVVPPDAVTGPAARLGEADALVSEHQHLVAGVRTADCLPILLVDAIGRRVGAIHAGWRGTVAGISPKTISAMCQFGSRPRDIWAAIGPGIGPCCFEVGPEVATRFTTVFPERRDLDRKTHLDLAEANRRQLLAAGIPDSQIELSGLCTVCRPEEFYSFRRDKEQAGRMLSAIGLNPESTYTKGARI